jgi:cyclopropane fatty-acyl-phospholipid synthase-like methyltransferase
MAVAERHKVENRELTPPYARLTVRMIRPFPNFDFFFVKSLRRKAASLLQLKPGGRVLDVGCGPGGSFPYLVDAVGPQGQVVGVEISPETAINARKRIAKNAWNNVQVVVSAAEKASLEGQFDGLLMFAAPDIYASPLALASLYPHLSSGARVVVFGGKLSRHRFREIPNLLFATVFSKLTFPSTPRMDYEPWALLKSRVHDLQVEEHFFGWMFLAWGSIETSIGNDERTG